MNNDEIFDRRTGGRFFVVSHKAVFRIADSQWEQLRQTSDNVISLFFRTKQRAEEVCALLNSEWREFLRNPC